MKKLCCIPCSPELPNLSLDFKCVSVCCGSRTDRSDMRSEMKADAMKELEAIEKEIEEVMTRVRCCCHIRKQKNQANAKNKKK